jgi:DNA-binding TFAR19-related protein (PDSD5 family)
MIRATIPHPSKGLFSGRWSFVPMAFLLFPFAGTNGQAALLDSPKRVVDGRTVDLTPLFHWWTNRHGSRPLTAWVRVGGAVTATNSLGWVISGHPEKSSAHAKQNGREPANRDPSQFILKDPPLEEAADFARLHQELKQAQAEKARLQSEASTAKAQEAQVQKAMRGALRAHATGQLRGIEKADTNLMKSVDRTIAQLKQKLSVYPNQDHYEVNSIALDTGTKYNDLPVYDRGRPLD